MEFDADKTFSQVGTSKEEFLKKLPNEASKLPTVLFVVGMAGAGKSTFIASFFVFLQEVMKKNVYVMNLDPAVITTPYKANLDIRDTINFKKVMKKYNLGPNGAILTSINLYATKFNEIMDVLTKRAEQVDYILVDTPGQLEVFNWSASGLLITSALAFQFPSLILFLADSERCKQMNVLMSNQLCASSIECRLRLPMIRIFSKSDLAGQFDFKSLVTDMLAIVELAEQSNFDSYSNSLAKSIALNFADIYAKELYACISIHPDDEPEGFDSLVKLIETKKKDYFEYYLAWLTSEFDRLESKQKKSAQAEYNKFTDDLDKLNYEQNKFN